MFTTKSTGFARLYYATLYSVKGLRAAFVSEPAIRQELAAMALLLPLACYLEVSLSEKLLMIMSLFIVLIVELLNSAIEALADRVSDEVHVLIGKAKDIGSAAVFISLLLVAVVWGAVLLKV
ncbi:diacylglycerol kinase [Salinimonas marina]|uniref:Diacylglycerol kinase n=1 Tax=Salinimonas marina TaxID=2785918 RepID=A0A7S9E007_9ALTE|nr:diacylglycerol kinase [Salinimonas marina]QPG07032.1 diacylglycerol kinase [Salinimonas marina]